MVVRFFMFWFVRMFFFCLRDFDVSFLVYVVGGLLVF